MCVDQVRMLKYDIWCRGHESKKFNENKESAKSIFKSTPDNK